MGHTHDLFEFLVDLSQIPTQRALLLLLLPDLLLDLFSPSRLLLHALVAPTQLLLQLVDLALVVVQLEQLQLQLLLRLQWK